MRAQLQVSSQLDQVLTLTAQVGIGSRTWALNDVGTCQIQVPLSHAKLTDIIAWGNIVRIREDGVPPWVGQVTSREWGDGVIVLGCKSAEWMLKGKLTGQGRVYGAGGNANAGGVAADLFHNAAVVNNALRVLQPGQFICQKPVFREYNYADLFDAFKALATDTTSSFWVDERLQCHFMGLRGLDKRASVVLREGKHISGVRLVEDAESTVNAIVGLGSGSSITTRPKLLRYIPGQPFFRAKVLDAGNVPSPAGLVEPVQSALIEGAQPKLAVDATISRVNGVFEDFWIGDLITLTLKNNYYPKLEVRVVGIELSGQDAMRAVFEVLPVVTVSGIQEWNIL